jgi:electron transport complex protein RnfE
VNAFTLGLATLFVLVCSNVMVSCLARFVPSYLRLPFFVLLIASFVTLTQIYLSLYFYNLYESLGIYLALITTNCVILGRAEGFASKHSVLYSFMDALTNGLGFLLILCAVGGLRELVGQSFLLALLPPGAFMTLGLIIAFTQSNWIKRYKMPYSTEMTIRQIKDPQ